MLPLEPIFLIPSLFVTPVVLAVAYFWRRRSESYPRFWWTAVVICFLLTLYFTVQVLSTPLYSQRDHSPDNPGGFSVGLFEILAVFLAATCLVIPAFPALLGLAFLPPRNLRTKRQAVLIVLYVVAISALIVQKHVRYMADYRQERARPKQTPFERFEHLRTNPAGEVDRAE